MTITFLSGWGPSGFLPTYIVGPVIDKAVEVEIRLANGQDMHVPTFRAPAPFKHIRFYATQIQTALSLSSFVGSLKRSTGSLGATRRERLSPASRH
jgi:hypothetical protein